MKKPLIWILTALVLAVLFPDLPQAIAAVVSAVVVWVSTQPILVGVGIGMAALPHLRHAIKPAAKTA
ncbi:hypothetical protein [[Kitasatospora] papulosa]|uniref:Uncharacterized protein n=1 Tax=[Kitasatospora] papulosa TaxID=1464011 RepID=A0ABZ1KAE1_9ACTN